MEPVPGINGRTRQITIYSVRLNRIAILSSFCKMTESEYYACPFFINLTECWMPQNNSIRRKQKPLGY